MLSSTGLTILWAFVLVILCHAGPINRQASGHNTLRLDGRNQSNTEQNVCVNDDVLYQSGDLMPAPNPCSRCVCSPPGSVCTPVACEKKPGCKALQRPNQCCPEYQCECERNGRRYQNGERLDNADNPCEACYCQGGEVVCTTVECYRRDDCEPQFVAGRCCPKYDHCPPLVMDDSRFAEPSSADSARPQHTRATFQPSTSTSDADDQDLGASNVQERVQLPQEVATATTTSAPATEADSITAATTEAPPQLSEASDVTDAPPSVPADSAIKIEVPAVPWTETSNDNVETTTAQAIDAIVEGSGAADIPDEKSSDAALEGAGEPVLRDGIDDVSDPTEETPTTVAADNVKEESTESQTEKEIAVTRLFMISKEAELDPTTVSSEYTDMPEEMSTTPEVTAYSKETTVPQGVDLSTEALIEANAAAKGSAPQESSTDSSPEFKDFDEWTGVKSSEFLRDSASTGTSSGHVDSSSSSSDSHSKQTSSSSDESTSHFLATNIKPETVKLSSDTNLNSDSSPKSEGSSTDSTESSENSEESATTEISHSTEHENIAKSDKEIDVPLLAQDDGTASKEDNPAEERIDLNQSKEKTSEDDVEKQNNEKKKGQLDIILDTVATDENGPPILLIGDDLANHQMDIVVATVPTETPETATNKPEAETRISDKEPSTEQPETATGETPSSDDTSTDSVSEGRTENPDSATTVISNDGEETQTEVGVAASAEAKDASSSTEKLDTPTTTHEMMLSDAPLPGQASSSETAANDENLDAILGKTDEKKEEPQKEDEAQSATVLTTVPVEDTTINSAELRIGDLRTESPEKESTTNTAKSEDATTLEPRVETTTIIDFNEDSKSETSQDKPLERISEQLGDIVDETATNLNPGSKNEENTITTESVITERNEKDSTVPSVVANDGETENGQNEGTLGEAVDLRAQTLDNQKEEQKDESDLKSNESPTERQKDTTILPSDATEIPTTQYPVTFKVSNTKDTMDEELLLGDQPQADEPAAKIQSNENSEEKKNKEEIAENEKMEQETENIKNTESEESTELAQRIDLEIPSETEQKSESDSVTESELKTEPDQNTESFEKSEPQSEHNTESQKIQEQKDSAEKGETVTEQQQLKQNEEELGQILVDTPKKEEEPSQILVDSTDAPKNEDAIVKTADLVEDPSGEVSTPPPDTTISDANVQEEETTNAPAKVAETEAAPSSEEPTTSTADEEKPTDVKINPEVLELKPAVSPPAPSTNVTEYPQEIDPTTLSPEWLKAENDSKADVSQKQKEQQQPSGEAAKEESQDNTEAAPAVTDRQTLEVSSDAESAHDLQQQQRLERRADETDKKDLFLLEDFFTKLYRHQIATDSTKH